LIHLSSWTRASVFYKFEPDKGEMVPLALVPEGPYDHPADLVSEELKVKSHDGTAVPYEGGHGIGNTREQQIRRRTDLLAFMLWQCGDPDFQAAKPGS